MGDPCDDPGLGGRRFLDLRRGNRDTLGMRPGLWLLFLCACAPVERPGVPPRHLLLLTVEGLRPDHTSAFQYRRETTRVASSDLDRQLGRALSFDDLAADGVLFSQAFTPRTLPEAALQVLFSGSNDPKQGAADLAQRLAAAGLQGHAFVHSAASLPAGIEEGFLQFERCASDLEVLKAALPLYREIDWGSGQGVFLWVHLSGPTFPFEPGRSVLDYSQMEGSGLRQVDCALRYLDPAAGAFPGGGDAASREAAFAKGPPPRASVERALDLYDGEVHELALNLWTLLGFFAMETRSEAPLDETLVVFAGLHGLELDRPGVPWGTCGEPHDSSLAVPLFLRHRDSLTGRRVLKEVVTLADVTPTLLEWFGAARPEDRDGRSLLALTDRARVGTFPSRPALAQIGQVITARGPTWRLVRDKDGREQAFDLGRDPREEVDRLAENPPELIPLRRALTEVARKAP